MPNFKNKKITLMGLGLLGRGIEDAKFLARERADLIVTDLKTRGELRESLNRLKKFKNIKYTLGKHRVGDFKRRDMILRSASVPQDSKYLEIARKEGTPIEMDDSLFAKYCPCPIIGVTGTRGKTTVATLIYEIFKRHRLSQGTQSTRKAGRCPHAVRRDAVRRGPLTSPGIYLAGNIPGVATLPLIKEVNKNDLVVLELSSWQLQGWDEAKISPRIAVITNIYPDHLNYYKGDMKAYVADKKASYKYQTRNDFLVLNRENSYSPEFAKEAKSKVLWFSKKDAPHKWKIKLPGEHNLENIAAAITVAKLLKIKQVREVIESFKGIEHRLELVREIKGIKYINDTTSTTPVATQKALMSFDAPIILIAGGEDKGLDFKDLAQDIERKCKAVVLLKGKGTERLKFQISNSLPTGDHPQGDKFQIHEYSSLIQAVKKAKSLAQQGDIVLFSPACTSFGMFKNEYDRGEKFKSIAKSLQ